MISICDKVFIFLVLKEEWAEVKLMYMSVCIYIYI